MKLIFIYITIKILDIIHHHVFNLKQSVSQTEFCFRLQLEPIHFGPKDIVSF
jgi:hypothetical protein